MLLGMSLVVENLSYEYLQGIRVLDDVSFTIEDGEIVLMLGPSGCGKSTLLHCITGLITPTAGTVRIDGKDVTRIKPHARNIGIMMQDQPLYEHFSVEQNIAFPLRARGEKKQNVCDVLEQFQLADIATQKVSKCSGGERRRVAFGRAVITKPKVLLLDEPFVSLNVELRKTMSESIANANVSTLLVSHDFEELTSLYDRAIILENQ
jgi:ABC-type sugar transport system ATPase subunit